MFSTKAIASAIIISSALLARAQTVVPTEPGPGSSFNAGTTCKTVWTGDSSSPTAWSNMTIELMSGDNQNMVHITTVTTGQDGTKDGSFEFTCPEVTPNSAIYFFQYSSPATGSKALTWTTRFTIASSSGATTDPANPTQPDGQAIPWGVGNLVDASTAVGPPSYLAGIDTIAGASSASGAAGATGSAGAASGASAAPSSNSAAVAGSTGGLIGTSSSSLTVSVTANPSVSKSSAAPSTSASGAATGMRMNGAGSAWVFAGVAAALAFV